MKAFDAIVLGLGGMGSAALYHLAARGLNVLGLEQFDIAHDRGSSHGVTRLIRKAYFEHPDYVPLVTRSYERWRELEAESNQTLLTRTGLLMFGPPDGDVIRGVRRAATEHNLSFEEPSLAQAASRWPGFVPDPAMVALYEPDAGTLAVERCVRVHVALAAARGATVRFHEPVVSWEAGRDSVVASTNQGRYVGGRLMICGGSWSGRILKELRLPLRVLRKVVFWYEVTGDWHRQDRGCPVFCFDALNAFYYGFPVIDAEGLKLADHHGGEPVDDPDHLDRGWHESDQRGADEFVRSHLRGVGRVRKHAVCMYTMTPDQHFIIDQVPDQPNVIFAAGFSGHGFKFAPMIGSILADLAIEGMTKEPIEFLRLSRPALRVPAPPPEP